MAPYTLADIQKFCVQLMDGDRVATPRKDTVPESSPSQGESQAPEPEPEGLRSEPISDPTEVGSNFVLASMLAVKKRLGDSLCDTPPLLGWGVTKRRPLGCGFF
jgi:hypothetical protein